MFSISTFLDLLFDSQILDGFFGDFNFRWVFENLDFRSGFDCGGTSAFFRCQHFSPQFSIHRFWMGFR